MVISKRGKEAIKKELGKSVYLKEESIGPPSVYSGNKVSKVTSENSIQALSFSLCQYMRESIGNVEKCISDRGKGLPKRCVSSLKKDYRLEIGVSIKLQTSDSACY